MSTSSGQQNYGSMPQYNSGGTTQNPYSNAWGGPDLRVGSTNVGQNMQRAAQNMPNSPYWLQTQQAGYYGAPMSSNPQEYGRWNWAQPQQGGFGQNVNQQPISTTPQPAAQPSPVAGAPASVGPQWNGQPNAPGDPWVSGSGYSSGIPGTEAPAVPGAPIIGNSEGLLGSAGAGQRIGGADWWAAIQAAQNRG